MSPSFYVFHFLDGVEKNFWHKASASKYLISIVCIIQKNTRKKAFLGPVLHKSETLD